MWLLIWDQMRAKKCKLGASFWMMLILSDYGPYAKKMGQKDGVWFEVGCILKATAWLVSVDIVTPKMGCRKHLTRKVSSKSFQVSGCASWISAITLIITSMNLGTSSMTCFFFFFRPLCWGFVSSVPLKGLMEVPVYKSGAMSKPWILTPARRAWGHGGNLFDFNRLDRTLPDSPSSFTDSLWDQGFIS